MIWTLIAAALALWLLAILAHFGGEAAHLLLLVSAALLLLQLMTAHREA